MTLDLDDLRLFIVHVLGKIMGVLRVSGCVRR